MSKSHSGQWLTASIVRGYGFASLSIIVAVILAQWPVFHLQAAPVSLFLCAIIVGAWYGGAGPSLFGTALSVPAFYYYALPPIHTFVAKPGEIPRFVIYTVSALVVGSICAAQRNTTESLRRAHGDLIGTVQQLQRANERLQVESRERKEAEEGLRRSEAYLAEAQRLSRTGSWAWAPDTGDTRFWSEECYRILGFDPEAGLPSFETFFQRIHPDDQARAREKLETARREKIEVELNYRILHSGGGIRNIHVVGHPVFSSSGDLVEFVGTVMDVTERRRAEEERERLRQAQADLAHVNRVTTMGELTATLAHEVNQPIAAAVTNANTCLRWLTRDSPNLEEAREAALRIVKDGTRAADIVRRIRLLFKKSSPQRELVEVNEMIRGMIDLLRGEATRYRITIRSDLATDLPEVMGDCVQLQQVLMNLMMNGIDAMKGVNGKREMAIQSQRTEDGQLLVSVNDTGVGLPPEMTSQIFNAFFTTKPDGTGMGLSISRSIIESHGGRLWASENSERGATFHLTLPANIEAHE